MASEAKVGRYTSVRAGTSVGALYSWPKQEDKEAEASMWRHLGRSVRVGSREWRNLRHKGRCRRRGCSLRQALGLRPVGRDDAQAYDDKHSREHDGGGEVCAHDATILAPAR